MESTEEEFSSFTTKGRRTKRQRSLLAATASSSYRGSGGGGGDGGAVVVLASTRGGDNCSDNNSYGSSSSGASPSDEHDIMSEVTTTEEEDMANCLILLAQGIERKVSHIIKSKTKINNNNNTSTTSTSNISTYECKTCNKAFPSFQALGGHRTSHKKIKPSTPTVVVPPARSPDTIDTVLHDRDRSLDDLDVAEFTSKKYFLVQSNNNNDASKARVHECSICGSEFPSGQALGGHMRRHRAAATTTTATTTIATSPISTTTAATAAAAAVAAAAATTTTVIDTGGPRNILSLDLNLPAPDDQDEQQHNIEVADHMDTKFVHVLPTPTPLVDCHY
ncbi:zinc finger protein ZAT5-like [Chenopodium quinoa]|uniref:zinc finger protein ZAT5-like n=1 Tax=Chenopodium quinoa TaxID=63459 RepID=UPI000B78F561|nr:zinc finger protein ZAT5-like [Chenopodium quinoa]